MSNKIKQKTIELTILEKKIAALEENLIKEIEKAIANFPQNKDLDDKKYKYLKIINYSGWSSGSWVPEYYDFKHQYKLILGGIQNIPILKGKLKFLNQIVKTGKINNKNGWYNTGFVFHSDVVETLKKLLYE